MKTTYEVWVPGAPVPQGRARSCRGVMVTPRTSRIWGEGARTMMRAIRQGRPAITSRCVAHIRVVLARPARIPDGMPLDAWVTGDAVPAAGRGDIDNYAKAALDAAVSAGWMSDDHLVVELVATKVYAARGKLPGLFLRVEAL